MQWLAEVCVKRPVLAIMIIMALVVSGIAAYPQLGVDRFPNMDLPTMYVRAVYPGASPEEVESEVTQILEDAIATVAGIDELRSISSEGSAIVIVTFTLNRELDAAVQDVRDAVGSVLNRLPPEIDPPIVRKQDTDSSPILTLAVSGQRDSRELYLLADRFVKNVIESAPGVGQVTIVGAAERAVQVNVDSQRLAAYGLSIMQVRDALARQNAEVPGGRVDAGLRELNLRTLGRVEKARDFDEIVVETVGGRRITLGDLGTVEDGQKEVRTLARLDGQPAVVLQVQRQSGTNTVEVIEGIKQRLPRCRELLPKEVEVSVIQDQSRYIVAALHEIQGHLISGSLLASIVVLFFMGSWRSTLIAAVAIPASVIATFAFMRAFDFTLNNVTMLALVLMVGVVIDDAIVVLENVFRFLEEHQMSPRDAAIHGTREIGMAVLTTTISLVIVFLPVSFLSSVTGRMLFQFGITATVAILVSMLVSFTLTPMMCSRLLRSTDRDPSHSPSSRRGLYGMMEGSYMWLLRWSLKFRWLVLLLCIGVIGLNWPLYQMVSQDYIPTNVDESEFEVGVQAKEGATLSAMDATMQFVEGQIQSIDGVQHVLATVGTRGFGGVNRGECYVRLSDIEGRTFSFGRLWAGLLKGNPGAAWEGNFTQQSKMQEIRSRLRDLKDCRVSVRNLTSLRQGAPVDIDFSLTAANIQQLAEFSEKLREKVVEIPGIVDVDTTLRLDKPEWRVHIDRERAASLGVDVREIADTLRIAVGGDDRVSRYRDISVDDAFDVELRLVGLDRKDPQAISQLFVRGAGGAVSAGATAEGTALTRIDNVVEFEYGEAQARIDRLDRQRMVAVRANIQQGYSLGDRISAVQAATAELGLPAGFGTRVMGRGRELERTLQDFGWTIVLSFVFMYIVLAAQYEHLVHPITILLSLPLAVPFGLWSLYIGGESLNLYSALGILVLFGVVKKASILQIDHTNHLRQDKGMERTEAILQANRDRLRPILMTVISFVAGLLPLLLATGPGAEERRSIAVVAVGGQTLSLLLTLLAIPVIYSILDDFGLLVVRREWCAKPATLPPERPATPA
ncbi:efflux RND transporter permease subunit [Planctellipticum variicoloris]|uniref:efflux RND transporter permease subunit n=1 Tax=Planctellipticum variicoloris TaxID=3064265 RepID=UPI003013DA9D|nr:efflux RND transporter permease subunit [Planctomycetaceae bacterium SH412]